VVDYFVCAGIVQTFVVLVCQYERAYNKNRTAARCDAQLVRFSFLVVGGRSFVRKQKAKNKTIY
jgi:hypothetical protein